MFEGHFKDGTKHGRGKFTSSDGEVVYEIWDMGQVKEIKESIETSMKRQGSDSVIIDDSKVHTFLDLDTLSNDFKSETIIKN